MIFSHFLGAKKFKVRLNSSKNCLVCVRITFDEMESSFTRFNFQFPRQFPSLNTTFFQTDNHKAMLFTVFRCQSIFSSCCIIIALAKENLLETPAIVTLAYFQRISNVATSRARIWLAICDFLWLLTNPNVLFVTSLHWINPLLHWIAWKMHLS